MSDALPSDLACRVILCERDLEEVLDSQERMLSRLDPARAATPERRRRLKDEYRCTVDRLKAMLELRRDTQLLAIDYGDAVSDAARVAERVNRFLDGGLGVAKMAAAIESDLYRNRVKSVG